MPPMPRGHHAGQYGPPMPSKVLSPAGLAMATLSSHCRAMESLNMLRNCVLHCRLGKSPVHGYSPGTTTTA
jgi:hypothetical protein